MGFYFVEKQHLENATDSPRMSKVLCINRKTAHNDSTEALRYQRTFRIQKSNYTQYGQSYNILTFDKPDNHPNITLSST